MQTDAKIIAKKKYEEAVRFMDNANKELQLADRNGKIYRDIKHLRVACVTAYLGVLKALDGFFLLRNIARPKKHPAIEYYQSNLAQIDKKVLNSLNVAYQILHKDGYYDGFNDIFTIKHGLNEAQHII